jgi:hypothetical protein
MLSKIIWKIKQYGIENNIILDIRGRKQRPTNEDINITPNNDGNNDSNNDTNNDNNNDKR